MKKFFCVLLTFAFILQLGMFASCQPKKPPIQGGGEQTEFDYMELYTTKNQVAYGAQSKTYRASHGYTKMNEQGYNGWYYMAKENNSYSQMTYGNELGGWKSNNSTLIGKEMTTTGDTLAVRKFILPESGKATIYGNAQLSKGTFAKLDILVNSTLIYSLMLDQDIPSKYFEIEQNLNKGDQVYFELSSGSVIFNPVITFENSQDLTLYHKTEQGKFYGDVFPYYDEEAGLLYNGFIWSDNCVVDGYTNALEVSENMLTFKDIPEENNYDIWRHYQEGGRLHYIYNPNNYVDHSKYPVGVRDNMIYYDEENERFLMIGGAYYEFGSSPETWKSDLVIFHSRDKMGFDWDTTGNVVHSNYSGNLPECPTLMKIGNRWYTFVSVSHITTHQIGRLQYWTGDENVDCTQVDWQNKPINYLDGEDLCAARPIKVKDKVYMWGWIPNKYDGVPLAPWAGYLNLPREVVAREDGSLGGRLDPALSQIVNYGNVYTLDSSNFTKISGTVSYQNKTLSLENGQVKLANNLKRNYVTFSADIKNAQSVGYILKQGDNEYRVSLVKENGKTYMKVTSPNDKTYKVNSYIEIGNVDKIDVKIVIDGNIMEFFVNDNYALTAITSIDSSQTYDGYLYSEGSVDFTNVSINKLIPYGEIE